jgi:hypothetical protein
MLMKLTPENNNLSLEFRKAVREDVGEMNTSPISF